MVADDGGEFFLPKFFAENTVSAHVMRLRLGRYNHDALAIRSRAGRGEMVVPVGAMLRLRTGHRPQLRAISHLKALEMRGAAI